MDARSSLPFLIASVPSCLVGAHFATACDERVLKAVYSVLMLSLSAFLILERDEQVPNSNTVVAETEVGGDLSEDSEQCVIDDDGVGMRIRCTPEGTEYSYKKPELGFAGAAATAAAGALTGLLGVGVGEVCVPQVSQCSRLAAST